jgi:hypothetical protein
MLEDKIWDPIQKQEDEQIRQIRGLREGKPPEEVNADNKVGIACSGGGIRTATLNLGILEVLREKGILEKTDYLSTVSGGGFVGSWLTASELRHPGWVKRPPSGSRDSMWDDSIKYLRSYSNYLSPRFGFLSADSWTMFMIWVRNTMLIQTTLAFFLAAVMLAPRVTGAALQRYTAFGDERLLLPLALFLFACWHILRNIKDIDTGAAAKDAGQVKVQWLIVVPVCLFALLAGSELWRFLDKGHQGYGQLLLSTYGAGYWKYAIVFATVIHAVFAFFSLRKPKTAAGVFYAGLAAVVGTIALYSLIILILFLFQDWQENATRGSWCAFLVGGPAVVYALSLSLVLEIGMLGAYMPDERREWWSRLGAWLFIYGSGWIFISVVSVLGPFVYSWVLVQGSTWIASVGTGWLLTTLAAVASSSSRATSGSKAKEKKDKVYPLEWLTAIGPYIFLGGLFILVAAGIHMALMQFSPWHPNEIDSWAGAPIVRNYWSQTESLSGTLYLAALGICMAGLALFAWRVDINEFSLNMFYRNRLVRCYLGASRYISRQRKPHPFTGFDEKDNLMLSDFADEKQKYSGPFPILNTTLNLGASGDLQGGIQSRQSAPFFFTPLHAGCSRPKVGFQAQSKYRDRSISMGTAVAISGAAASPNQGYHTSPVVAFLMTLFNVRLGWWMPNPKHLFGKGRENPGLNFSMQYLLMELFGMAGEDSDFVNLSDGGHLENLGIYELVRRKCSLIVAGDGEQDLDMHFCSLGNMIRMCAVDHGADIDIDISRLRKDEATGLSDAHCAVGKITYSDGTQGTLIYLKSSLTGDEPTDVQQYKSEYPDFPHETTADQFFDEAQFESYRKLGRHIAEQAFEEAFERRDRFPDLSLELPVVMSQIWHTKSAGASGAFAEHSKTLTRIWKDIRDNPELGFLDSQTYPEWGRANPAHISAPWIPKDPQQFRKAFYVCNDILQLMENVYLDLKLENERDHPDNAGWMNFFRHWSSSGMLRVTWAICGCTFSSGFQRFCRHHLQMMDDESKAVASFQVDIDQLNPVEAAIRAKVDPSGEYELKILRINVSDRLDEHRLLTLHAGFALVQGTQLRYMRIQDHLRQMGFGTLLIRKCGVTDYKLVSPDPKRADWNEERFGRWARRRGVLPAPETAETGDSPHVPPANR